MNDASRLRQGEPYFIADSILIHYAHITLDDQTEFRVYRGGSGTVYVQRTDPAGVQSALTTSKRETVKEALLAVLAGLPDDS